MQFIPILLTRQDQVPWEFDQTLSPTLVMGYTSDGADIETTNYWLSPRFVSLPVTLFNHCHSSRAFNRTDSSALFLTIVTPAEPSIVLIHQYY